MLCSPTLSSGGGKLGTIHVVVVQRRLKNVKETRVMHVQSCCFASLNLFFPWSLPLLLPSSLPKLPIVVIQKFCYHGNVTSHFSLSVHSLWVLGRLERKKKRARGARRRREREPNLTFSLFPSIPARSLLFLLGYQAGACAVINTYASYLSVLSLQLAELLCQTEMGNLHKRKWLQTVSPELFKLCYHHVSILIDQSSRPISVRENRLVIVKLDLDLLTGMMS